MREGLKEIGHSIAKIREERNVTQKELGEMLGTTQSAIARMEKGEQNLSTDMLSKIGRALHKDVITLSKGSMNLEIEGGKKLKGSVITNTSKNGAVVLLCASLLNKDTTVLKNMPRIEEVYRIIEVLQSIGVHVAWHRKDLEIKPGKVSLKNINVDSARKTRSVLMLIGPLIHLFDEFTLPVPGGCKLGLRTVRPHFYALEELGIKITDDGEQFHMQRKKTKSRTIVMYESGDTATENVIMAAARMRGVTTIKYASANYQVQDLCFFLEKLGIRIEGIGTTTLIIHGTEAIDTPIEYPVSEDPTDVMFFLAAAIVTKSSITIKRCPIDFLELELLVLQKMGFRYRVLSRYKAKNGKTNLVDLKTSPSTLSAPSEKIAARPYPGLNMDNLPFFAVIATQAKGQTLIHDWVYEKRALYYTELDRLGAETVLADPHRIYIAGPSHLQPADLTCPPALRPATLLLIAMLATNGKSTLRNIYSINRGYEDLVSRLNQLGAHVRPLQGF